MSVQQKNQSGNSLEGWSTTSDKYHTHVSQLEKSLSIAGAPQYPNLHSLFNRKFVRNKTMVGDANREVYEDENGEGAAGVDSTVHKQLAFQVFKWKSLQRGTK
ncbi:hypothetical protein Sjap_016258 [Stephania japonica]|uniref:Uncharacterized protein n=1 Tax=Stephania japonica TaxID=461633 RepID=A0AAP0NUT9_9MAGN